MISQSIGYLTDKAGQTNAVVVPIAIWRNIFPEGEVSTEDLVEAIEDYCLSRAMDAAEKTPTMTREEAMAFLEDDSD
ncbi:MAG: hypothetical protein AAGN15_25945 [Cyanobacteria bacterium J06581_3]